jgi:NAD(P)-dependent dehydrogenase (short-subunit alcohol dehydrogenase family)
MSAAQENAAHENTAHENTVAVVTGAASGIGRATALRLARDGFHVAMMDLDTAGLAATHDRIKAAGGRARAFAVDLCDPLEVGSITREIAVTIGSPEVLVNVAGIGVAATVLETSDEDWNRVLAVNLTGPFLTTRATLPLMIDRGTGVIVNIASVAGQVGVPRRAAYCASKAGLVGLTKAIAVDHGHEGIRSVAICPGTAVEAPEEIAAMVAFVAGPAGRFINGAALIVDGGMTAA